MRTAHSLTWCIRCCTCRAIAYEPRGLRDHLAKSTASSNEVDIVHGTHRHLPLGVHGIRPSEHTNRTKCLGMARRRREPCHASRARLRAVPCLVSSPSASWGVVLCRAAPRGQRRSLVRPLPVWDVCGPDTGRLARRHSPAAGRRSLVLVHGARLGVGGGRSCCRQPCTRGVEIFGRGGEWAIVEAAKWGNAKWQVARPSVALRPLGASSGLSCFVCSSLGPDGPLDHTLF